MEEALESLRLQNMGEDLEIIIQDGDVEPDMGQSDALNKGFAKAHGEWFFWLNADDVLLPGALEKVRRLIRAKGGELLDWIAGNQVLIDSQGLVKSCSVGNGWKGFLYRHAVPHVYGPSSFFRSELYQRVGGFDTTLSFCMDWDIWIRFAKDGAQYTRIGEYLWAQRQWEGSKTQRKLTEDEFRQHREELSRMLKANDLNVTSGGIWLMRMWRLLNGNYMREVIDGFCLRGKTI